MGKVIPFEKIPKSQNREQWLEQRLVGIGGSEAGAVLEMNDYKKPVEVWMEKTGKIIPQDISDKESVYWGNVLEDVIAKEFEKRNGIKVRRNNFILKSKKYPFMLANLDREGIDKDGKKFVLEIKTAGFHAVKQWGGENIPKSYEVQVRHYLIVTGYDYAIVAGLIGGQTYKQVRIDRDPHTEQYIIDKEEEFWKEYVEKDEMPPVDGSISTNNILNEMFPGYAEEQSTQIDNKLNTSMKRRQEIIELLKDLEEEKREIEQDVKSEMKDHWVGLTDKYIAKWTPVTSNRVDTKLLKANYPEIHRECLKESKSRRFSIKELKK